MFKLLAILLGLHVTAASSGFQSRNFIHYWIRETDVEDNAYSQDDATCEECQFPYSYEGELIYGCRPYGNLQNACKNSTGAFVTCSYQCPVAGAQFLKLLPSSGADDDSVVLECHGIGSPNPSITLKKDGEVIDVMNAPTDAYPAIVKSSIILKYEMKYLGTYSCDVDNGYSSDSSGTERHDFRGSYTFTGVRLPSTPTNLRVTDVVRTYVTLEWDFEELERNYQRSYEVLVTPGRVPEKIHYRVRFIFKKSTTIKHLQPGVKYEFRVRRVSNLGYGLYSEPVYTTIPSDAPLDRPVNVTVVSVDTDKVILTWDLDGELKREQEGVVHVHPGAFGGKHNSTGLFYGDRVTVFGLTPNQNYTFEVELFIQTKLKRRAEPVFARTLPIPPSIKSLEASDDDHYEVIIKCTVFGAPLPQVKWTSNGKPLPPAISINTSSNLAETVSVLTLPRTALVYNDYTCLASSSLGTVSKTIIVPYNGNHPPVALTRMVMQLSEDIKKIEETLESHEELLWLIFNRL